MELNEGTQLIIKYVAAAFAISTAAILFDDAQFYKDKSIIVFALVFVLFCFLTYDSYRIKINQKELNQSVLKRKEGFILIAGDELNSLALNALRSYADIRVIGSGRQDFLDRSQKGSSAIQKYYNNILKPLKIKHDHSYNKITYRRIVPRELKKKFKEHIINSLDKGRFNNHEVSVVVDDNFNNSSTYLIIDKKLIILSVEYEIRDGYRDNTLNLYSKNPKIISEYINHFDSIYSRHKQIITSLDFKIELGTNKEILNNLNFTIEKFNEISNSSTRNHHAAIEIEQTKNRVEGLANKNLSIDHKVANGKLLNVLAGYMDQHEKGDLYQTVSFYEFWSDVMRADKQELFSANEKIIKAKVNVERIFIVRQSWLDEYYNGNKVAEWDELLGILKKHCELMKKAPCKTSNYRFRIYFQDDTEYKSMLDSYINFVLMKFDTKDEIVLVIPDNNQPVSKFIGQTDFKFFTSSSQESILKYYKNRIKSYMEEQEEQESNLTQQQQMFLKEVGYSA